MKKAPSKTFIKIVDRKGIQHVVPDNRHNRSFHVDNAIKGKPEDKPKSVELVTGNYVPGDIPGAQEFELEEVKEVLFENLTPQDSQLEAATAENETLRAQIELLQKQIAGKEKPGAKDKDDKKKEGKGEGE